MFEPQDLFLFSPAVANLKLLSLYLSLNELSFWFDSIERCLKQFLMVVVYVCCVDVSYLSFETDFKCVK